MPSITRITPVARLSVLGVALFANTAAILAHINVNTIHNIHLHINTYGYNSTHNSVSKYQFKRWRIKTIFKSRHAYFINNRNNRITYRIRLAKALPEIVLSVLAVLIGVTFLCIAGYGPKLPIELRMSLICVARIMLDVFAFYIKGNSSGLVFTLMTFLIYIICMGILSMQRYRKQQMEIAKLDRQVAQKNLEILEQKRRITKQSRELAAKERKLTDSRKYVIIYEIFLKRGNIRFAGLIDRQCIKKI